MDKLIKNIEHKTVLKIKDEVTYQKGQIVSKTLSQNEHHSLTLFAFDKGEEISTHESGGDAMIVALDGVGKITIEGEEFILNEGETIVMPAKSLTLFLQRNNSKCFLSLCSLKNSK